MSWLKNGRGRTGLFLVACGLLFLGERMLTGDSRLWAVGLVSALVALSLALRFMAARGGKPLGSVDRRLLFYHLVATAGLLLYGLTTQALRSRLGFDVPGEGERDTFGVVIAVLWPILLLAGTVPMVLMEIAASPMRRAAAPELRRLRTAARAGLSAALAFAFLLVLNYLGTVHDIHEDLAYFRTTRPGSATVNLVKHLQEDVDVVLFFPRANEVLERVQTYMAQLEPYSDHLKVVHAERLRKPTLARKHRVREDGIIVVARGNKRKTWKIKPELKKARRQLSKLDGEFLKALSEVASPARQAYLLVGHGEFNEGINDDGTRGKATDRMVREVLAYHGYKLKNLGAVDGLATAVPSDADVVLVLGPRKRMLSGEARALAQYVEGGGRLLFAMEPEGETEAEPLFRTLGLTLDRGLMHHTRFHLRRSFDLSDRRLLATSSFSSHASVKTLSRATRKTAVAFEAAGSLEKRTGDEDAPKGRKVDFTVRSMPDTWADKDGDHQFDAKAEKRKVYNLAAAVMLPAPEARKGDKGAPEPGRAVVISDGGVFSDEQMKYTGNLYLLSDSLRYLQGEENLAGTIEIEEDQPIQHTRDEDMVWFYGTVFILPLFVLGAGMTYVRRRRRRRA